MIALLFSIIHFPSYLLRAPDEQIKTVQLLLAIMQRVQLVTAAAAQKADQILLRTGGPDRLLRQLRKCRCRRMEELHERQRRVDRLDYLIRQTETTRAVK